MPVTVERFGESCAEPLRMRLVAGGDGLSREIADAKVQKAGLAITGEIDSTHRGRVQILGETELGYFANQPPARREEVARLFFSRPMACAVAAGDHAVPAELADAAELAAVPLFSSALETSDLISGALKHLGRLFSETSLVHGVLMDVLGVGVLLLGRSGIGKSECALDLIVRGHRFVADDAIFLEKRGEETLVGKGGDLTRHHMEIRGLGIISVRDLFGLTAIGDAKKIELVIELEAWDERKEYDRLGLEGRTTVFLGVPFPTFLIPVSPGRNLATIVEVAVRNHILRKQGVDSARDLVERHGRQVKGGRPE